MKYQGLNHVIILGLITLIQIVTQASSLHRNFSTNLAAPLKLRGYDNVTITQCEEECGGRWRCHGVVYRKEGGLCTLLMNHPDGPVPEVKIAEGDTVLVTGFEQGAVLCGSSSCGYREICNDTGQCQVEECGEPPRFFSNYDGNMFGLDNRIRIPTENLTLRCNLTGAWVQETNYTMFDCTNFTGMSGVYNKTDSYYKIYCDMDTEGGNWLVFQRRKDGSVNFERGWNYYELGFGDLTGEFWLGLELLHQILTAGQYELRIDLEDFYGNQRYAKYSTFRLAGPEENYKIDVSGYTGTAEDGMAFHDGMQFSTFDRDNDFSSRHCAERFHGAWWHMDCFHSSLNGKYFNGQQNTTERSTHIHWVYLWPEAYRWYSLKRTVMKIRRKPSTVYRSRLRGGGRRRRRRSRR